ncbi:hypothetical protein EDD37DRAFT_470325 [Exophiala viscosa]|uniref:uncharacterized protein n=1 Tax=Exophiala viscosa TaxID=2486360 RepID=UPI002192C3D7|nr:hypothetical protein EDD37DRAFT_470325 [Exophiala viscosa]
MLEESHYSYECKSSAQERPYISRPSRTQQLLNPKLKPKLTSDKPNELLNSRGVADQQLAEAEARRNGTPALESESRGRSLSPRANSPSRSRSIDSASSVSTISTAKSRSRSHSLSESRDDRMDTGKRAGHARSRTPPRKRKHHSDSSSYSRSPRSPKRAPSSHHKTRRHRSKSPSDRGRPNSTRRGSHRSRTSSPSMDQSRITKHRRSLGSQDGYREEEKRYSRENRPQANGDGRRPAGFGSSGAQGRGPRRERSLSPYSKRLALTQAMNL